VAQQFEVVIEPGGDAEAADEPIVAGDPPPSWLIVISRAPIVASTRSPTRATGTE
jgi:hypothetical protein